MAAALQIWSATFCRTFDALPTAIQTDILRRIDDLGTRLAAFPHQRLSGRSEFKLRVGDYRVLYEFDAAAGKLILHYVGHRRDIYKRS
jgi:mRNA interferase RelE/StbE